jgi:hypothetical protein
MLTLPMHNDRLHDRRGDDARKKTAKASTLLNEEDWNKVTTNFLIDLSFEHGRIGSGKSRVRL